MEKSWKFQVVGGVTQSPLEQKIQWGGGYGYFLEPHIAQKIEIWPVLNYTLTLTNIISLQIFGKLDFDGLPSQLKNNKRLMYKETIWKVFWKCGLCYRVEGLSACISFYSVICIVEIRKNHKAPILIPY